MSICQGFYHRRMRSDRENLGECDLKSPAWLWDSKGRCPRQSQQGRGSRRGSGGSVSTKGPPWQSWLHSELPQLLSPVTFWLLQLCTSHTNISISAGRRQIAAVTFIHGEKPPQKQTQSVRKQNASHPIRNFVLGFPWVLSNWMGLLHQRKSRSIVISCERCFDQGPEQMSAAFTQNPADGKKNCLEQLQAGVTLVGSS